MDENITKEVVEDFEAIRASGVTNMYDRSRVQYMATSDLSDFTSAEYAYLLSHYAELMAKFEVKRL